MTRLDDFDFEDAVERIFGSTLMDLEFGRLAEVLEEKAPPGHERYHALLRLDEARELCSKGHPGPAAVVAQSVAEGYFQEAMEALFAASGASVIHDAVREALREFQLSRKDHLNLYRALSGDVLSQAPFWGAYRAGVQLRNAWVHGPVTGRNAGVTLEAAEQFVLAIVDFVAHVEPVLTQAGVRPGHERFHIEWRNTEGERRLEARVTLIGDSGDETQVTVELEADD
jgi:hypothetical protein